MTTINLKTITAEKIILNISSTINSTQELTLLKTYPIKNSTKEVPSGFYLIGNLQAEISVHNNDETSHESILKELAKKANTSDVQEHLDLKSNTQTTYTKTETNSALSLKVDISDTTVTKQGNDFNGANQLVQLDEDGILPAIDGSNLTGIANGIQIASCPTDSATAEKIITIDGVDLVDGMTLLINFDNANTASVPTLNFNGTVKSIINEAHTSVNANNPAYFPAGVAVEFTYNETLDKFIFKNRIVTNYINGNSWYNIRSDGWIEQGGKTSNIAAHSTGSTTLLKNFTNTNYNIYLTDYKTAQVGDDGSLCIHSKYSTYFILYNADDGTLAGQWNAKGY